MKEIKEWKTTLTTTQREQITTKISEFYAIKYGLNLLKQNKNVKKDIKKKERNHHKKYRNLIDLSKSLNSEQLNK